MAEEVGAAVAEVAAPASASPVAVAVSALSKDDLDFVNKWPKHFMRTSKQAEDVSVTNALVEKIINALKVHKLEEDVPETQVRQLFRSNALPLSGQKQTRTRKLLQTTDAKDPSFTKLRIIDVLNNVLAEHVRMTKESEKKPVIREVKKEPTPTQVWKEHQKETKRLQKQEAYKNIDKPVKIAPEQIVEHILPAQPVQEEEESVSEVQEEAEVTPSYAERVSDVTAHVEKLQRAPVMPATSFEDYYSSVLQRKRAEEEERARQLREQKAKPKVEASQPQALAVPSNAYVPPAPVYAQPNVQYIPIYMPPPPEYMTYARHKKWRRKARVYESSSDSEEELTDEDPEPRPKKRKYARVSVEPASYEADEEDEVEEEEPRVEAQPQKRSPQEEYVLSMANQFLGNGRY